MIRKIIVTADNSKSLLIPHLDETYHSVHGARSESQHIFIDSGLAHQLGQTHIRILEMGFGTGLNALLTLAAISGKPTSVTYDTVEKYPVDIDTVKEIDHPAHTSLAHLKDAFFQMHTVPWDAPINITPTFCFKKMLGDLKDVYLPKDYYTLIYYDAFAPKIQPDLWDYPMMQKLYDSLQYGGTLLTYCAQGQFRRNLRTAGFTTERLSGPAGKREITLARK